MITLLVKLTLITGLVTILFQDIKERAVWWFLFPVFLISSGWLHFQESISGMFWKHVVINLACFAFIILLAFLYAILKMKVNFLKDSMGLGDLCFFFALSFAFPTGSFVVLLVFSMVFSLLLHLFLQHKNEGTTVPLAGYASLFLIFIYLSNWMGVYSKLYQIG